MFNIIYQEEVTQISKLQKRTLDLYFKFAASTPQYISDIFMHRLGRYIYVKNHVKELIENLCNTQKSHVNRIYQPLEFLNLSKNLQTKQWVFLEQDYQRNSCYQLLKRIYTNWIINPSNFPQLLVDHTKQSTMSPSRCKRSTCDRILHTLHCVQHYSPPPWAFIIFNTTSTLYVIDWGFYSQPGFGCAHLFIIHFTKTSRNNSESLFFGQHSLILPAIKKYAVNITLKCIVTLESQSFAQLSNYMLKSKTMILNQSITGGFILHKTYDVS